jgi:nucleotide-binding universal stress UspA family protein
MANVRQLDGQCGSVTCVYRDIMVHVDGTPAGRRRVRYAIDLAARTGARVVGLHVTPPAEVPPRFKPSLVAGVADEISLKLASDARAASAIFEEEAMRPHADARWSEVTGDVAKGIRIQARYSDIVVIGQYEWQGSPEAYPLSVAQSVIFKCGRPVLVVPASMQPGIPTRIALPWDRSRESVRAVHDALPLLRLSRSVQIMTVIGLSSEDEEDDVECLSAHLADHGITVESHVLESRSAKEHELPLQRIEKDGFDLLVMGGYSRPPWREFIFGGTMQSVLLSSKVPILVSY